MYRISAVSYTNSIPFVYGLKKSPLIDEINLSIDFPSQCAQKLINDSVDIGLVPVAAIPQIPNAKIISEYCIGSIGKVNTVMLFSEVPIQQIKRVWLDFQSRTSVSLVQVLFREHWKSNPQFLKSSSGFEKKILNDTAAVVIGDRCFELNKRFPFRYDLSEAWNQLTGLPFVFACWVSNKNISVDFIKKFNLALSLGLESKSSAISELLHPDINVGEATNYLKDVISYSFDISKQQALELFLEKIKGNG